MLAGFGFGAFVFNFVSTAIVNPRHEEADPNTGMFPRDVAENVPKMIRILSMCWAGLSVIGIIMIFPYEEDSLTKSAL